MEKTDLTTLAGAGGILAFNLSGEPLTCSQGMGWFLASIRSG